MRSQGCVKNQPLPRRQSLPAAVRVQKPQCKLVVQLRVCPQCISRLVVHNASTGHSLIFSLSISPPATAGPAAPGSPLYSEVVRGSEEPPEAPGSPASSCPLCRRRNWNQVGYSFIVQQTSFNSCFQVEGDMWRLEHWLEHSSATLSQLLRAGVPTSIEHLEEVIQDHREFLLQVILN